METKGLDFEAFKASIATKAVRIVHTNSGKPLFAITEDHLCEPKFKATAKEVAELKAQGLTAKFRLLDDDRELYFVGYGRPLDKVSGFAPLDDYQPSHGCTMIEYYNTKTKAWELL